MTDINKSTLINFLKTCFKPNDLVAVRIVPFSSSNRSQEIFHSVSAKDVPSLLEEQVFDTRDSLIYINLHSLRMPYARTEFGTAPSRCFFLQFARSETHESILQRITEAGLPAPSALMDLPLHKTYAVWRTDHQAKSMAHWEALQQRFINRFDSEQWCCVYDCHIPLPGTRFLDAGIIPCFIPESTAGTQYDLESLGLEYQEPAERSVAREAPTTDRVKNSVISEGMIERIAKSLPLASGKARFAASMHAAFLLNVENLSPKIVFKILVVWNQFLVSDRLKSKEIKRIITNAKKYASGDNGITCDTGPGKIITRMMTRLILLGVDDKAVESLADLYYHSTLFTNIKHHLPWANQRLGVRGMWFDMNDYICMKAGVDPEMSGPLPHNKRFIHALEWFDRIGLSYSFAEWYEKEKLHENCES